MTNAQVTLVQLDNYGPWTTTPAPRREADLQTLQARLFADLSQRVGSRDGYVFFGRFDNMVAVTNGIDLAAHRRLQESVRNRYPVTVSLAVGTGRTPRAALAEATRLMQDAGSAQDRNRREALRGDPLPADRIDRDALQVAHFDVVDATGRYTDELDAFASLRGIQRAYAALADYLYDRHDALAFFVGGDNVIAVCPNLSAEAFDDALAHVRDVSAADLRVGVGRGPTAHVAGMAAKRALEAARDADTRVECETPAVTGSESA